MVPPLVPSAFGPAVSLARASLPAVSRPPLSAVKATSYASPVLLTGVASATGFAAPGQYTVSWPTLLTVATSLPLGAKATPSIRPPWAGATNTGLPASRLYTRRIWSSPPAAIDRPSGLKARDLNGFSAFSGRVTAWSVFPVAASQTCSSFSQTVATALPSGLKATSAMRRTLACALGSTGVSRWPR